MNRRPLSVLWCLATLSLLPSLWAAPQQAGTPFRQAVEHMGVRLELHVDHAEEGKTPGVFHENDHLEIAFKITDAAGGTPMKSLFPAAWMDPVIENAPTTSCIQKVKTFLGGSVFTRADIDLNVFLVVTLTSDGFITVVDPLFSFGGSKLLGMIELESPGADWVISRDQRRLYVTLPKAGKLVEIDTSSWMIKRTLEVGANPRGLVLQPDQHYLWLTYGDPGSADSGVVAVAREAMTVQKKIVTGPGSHDLILDRDARKLFVSNSEAGTVSVVDVRSLAKTKDIVTGSRPIAMTYSAMAQMILVADHATGNISSIDVAEGKLLKHMKADKGLRQVEFAPGGRLAMAISPETRGLFIIDAARNRIIQSGVLKHTPTQISYSDTLGYIMHANSDQVLTAPLNQIGKEGEPIPLADFPGGYYAEMALDEPILKAVAKAPAENGVMLADAQAKAINYYMEGMAAPMGSFNNYHHPPKGILVIDRSLQEQDEPGFYQTVTKVEKAGKYDVVLFLDTPRIVHCFTLPVLPDPTKPVPVAAKLRSVTAKHTYFAGETAQVSVQLIGADGKPLTQLKDVDMTLHMAGGRWFKRLRAKETQPGIYTGSIVIPRAGKVSVYTRSKSAGLTYADTRMLPIQVLNKPKAEASQGGPQ